MPGEPQITEPPVDVNARLQALASELDAGVPEKRLDHNLLIATWNLRAFGGLTKKWLNDPADSPKRNFADVRYIAEIVKRFDVVALQEVRGDLRALRHLLKALGPDWAVIMTDVTRSKAGNDERLAFLYDTRRAKPSGLAGEFAEPFDASGALSTEAVAQQFARTPYAVSFSSAGATFILVTLHVLFGKVAADRLSELRAIARRLADFAKEVENWGHSLVCLGDFNIEGREGDETLAAFTSTGLTPAQALNEVPRTIFDKPQAHHYYDQIAWFVDPQKGPVLPLTCTGAGTFDFVPLLQGNLTKTALSFRISDHYPLWVEFSVRPQ
jgi:endonuclease/exonuclease/phosphatase family metal-dependent hydrolase